MTLDLDPPPPRAASRSAAALPIRPRRLRRTPALRALVRETRLHPAMLVAPLFVRSGSNVREPISSMPGQARLSPDLAAEEVARLAGLGVGGVDHLIADPDSLTSRRAELHRVAPKPRPRRLG